jgi:ParB family chromosome partitioning protein
MADATAPDFSDLVEGVISTIPLDRLMLSKLNVRQTERAADVDSLAEDIAARGLKQNLVVVPAHFISGEASRAQMAGEPAASDGDNIWKDRFEVIAGGRRFQALQLLVEQGRLSATLPVPCMVEYRDAAAETSLSENLHRVAMNPADEFEAYRVIVDQAKRTGSDPDPIAYCAKRFGVAVKHVNGRLRLASLAPEILEALRANEIGVDSAKAYAGTEDHALQLKVFAGQKKSTWKPHDAQQVRQALRGETLPLSNALVKFVGLDAYLAAGGRTEVEMFMGTEGEERIVDVKLAKKLATTKADELVAPAAKKDGFASGMLAAGVGKYNATWPKDPKEMERIPSWGDQPTKAQKKKCVGVYAIDSDGVGIEHVGTFRPVEKKAEPAPRRDWEAERAAEQRADLIETRAGRMTLPPFAGTPLEGRAFWPSSEWFSGIEADDTDENFKFVVVHVRVPLAEIEANLAEAERLIDEEAAAAQRDALLEELRAERIAAKEAAAQEQGA